MRFAHFVEMRVFSKEGDNEESIVEKIKELFPFDFKEEKIRLEIRTAFGFEDKKIHILTVHVDKERHIKKVMENLLQKISKEEKEILLRQLESRLDSNLHFYLRLEKDRLLKGEYYITDTGNCFHFTISIAAFPHKREIALEIVKKIFS